jgi:hypothetical protein
MVDGGGKKDLHVSVFFYADILAGYVLLLLNQPMDE